MPICAPLAHSEVSARAMRILRRMAERQPEMLQTCLAAGLKRTSALHECICSNYRASASAADAGKRGHLLYASSDIQRLQGHRPHCSGHALSVSQCSMRMACHKMGWMHKTTCRFNAMALQLRSQSHLDL